MFSVLIIVFFGTRYLPGMRASKKKKETSRNAEQITDLIFIIVSDSTCPQSGIKYLPKDSDN